MRPLLHGRLINPPFGDPGMIVEMMFDRRSLLIDLGDLRSLPARHLLQVSDVFVTHAHMDHFSGFDELLRLRLGRGKPVRMFGPPGFLDRVEHKLSGYTWNLVAGYAADFVIHAAEFDPPHLTRATFRSGTGFRREAHTIEETHGTLLHEPALRVRAAVLDHGTPCLGFAIEEERHVNVWKNRLSELGLPVGPWLRDLKRAVLGDQPPETPFRIRWRAGGTARETVLPLGRLRDEVLSIVPGQKIAYVTDVAYHEHNAARIAALARDADVLFIETPFLDADAPLAAAKRHLTAAQAGLIARRAGARRMVPFHFSPRYVGREAELRAEAERAFRGGEPDPTPLHIPDIER